MPSLGITSLYGGIFGVYHIYLSAQVIRTRREKKVNLGAGGEKLLERRIRAQGNFSEYVPIALILSSLLEFDAVVPRIVLYALDGALLCGRTLHAMALSNEKPWPFGRVGGMIMTLFPIGTMAILCALHGLSIL